MTNAIELQGVSRTFGRTTAIDSVNFAVPEHSILGLLGRNGVGKTTVMAIIAGQDRPSAGTAAVYGRAPFEHAPTLAQICFVRDNQRYPDDYKLHHVTRIAREFAPRWSDEVADELIERLRIPARTQVSKMSRGQTSAVAIVLSIASRAPITLLDEPYLGLDVTARGIFHEVLLRDYHEVPRTIVLSTHLIEESASLFDHVVIMDAGRIVVDESADDLAGSAWVLSGTASQVDAIARDYTVLSRHTIGALASVTISGSLDDAARDEATQNGVQVAPASLQQIVSTYGAESVSAGSSSVSATEVRS